MRSRRFLISGVVSLLAVAAIAGALVFRASKPPGTTKPLTLRTVSTAQLAEGGIRLAQPTGSSTEAERRAAVRAAVRWFGGLPAVEDRFARCMAGPRIDRDCWAVSLDTTNYRRPGGGSPGAPPLPPSTFLIVLVSPANNRVLDAMSN